MQIFTPIAYGALRAGELVTFLTEPLYGRGGALGKAKGHHQRTFV